MTATDKPMQVGFLLFPQLTQLDLTGPWEVFSRANDMQVHLVWKTMEPVTADTGLQLLPNGTFADAPQFDILCVPGGPGQVALMEDQEVLDFLRKQAAGAQYVTGVCTGSLVLGAAGLLRGVKATCHWSSIDQLALLGAVPVEERVVQDGRYITGAGVTSGIDFALYVVDKLFGAAQAQGIQLLMEYDPAPPHDSGSPKRAAPKIVAALREKMAGFLADRRKATEAAAAKLD